MRPSEGRALPWAMCGDLSPARPLCHLPSGQRAVTAPQGWSAVPWVGSSSVLPLGRLLHGPEMPQSSLLD